VKPTFSIIVPVYNVERYIHKCIDSIINQSFKNIEVILVDDGSPDNCPLICDEYSQLDNRIKVIHKVNGGLSDARNFGIKAAIGEYIMFLDSDDYLEENACELFSNYTKENIDIILGNAKEIRDNTIFYINHTQLDNPNLSLKGSEALRHELDNGTMHMAACMNVYRRDFLIENALFFKYGIFHEDEQWTPRVFLAAKKTIITDITFYNYIIRENSITRKKDKTKNAIDLINSIYELSEVYDSLEDDYLKKKLNNYLVMLYLNAFYIGRLYRSNYKKCIDKSFLKERATSRRNLIKVRLFCINTIVYFYINKLIKSF
jgi:glycosyltransferase involved in cell wall biosynthesis